MLRDIFEKTNLFTMENIHPEGNSTKELIQIFYYTDTSDFFQILFKLIYNNYDSDILNRITVLSKEHEKIKKHERMGMLSPEIISYSETRINNKLLDILSDIEKIDTNQMNEIKKTLKAKKTKESVIQDNIKKIKTALSQYSLKDKSEIGIIIFDIDEFTQINKVHGYSVGDEVLENIPQIVDGCLLKYQMDKISIIQKDWFGRDEYIILLYQIDSEELENIARSICEEVNNYDWNSISSNLRITISVSFSNLDEQEGVENYLIRNLIGIIDAKKNGKNRTEPARLPFIEEPKKKKANRPHKRTIKEAYNLKIQDYIS